MADDPSRPWAPAPASQGAPQAPTPDATVQQWPASVFYGVPGVLQGPVHAEAGRGASRAALSFPAHHASDQPAPVAAMFVQTAQSPPATHVSSGQSLAERFSHVAAPFLPAASAVEGLVAMRHAETTPAAAVMPSADANSRFTPGLPPLPFAAPLPVSTQQAYYMPQFALATWQQTPTGGDLSGWPVHHPQSPIYHATFPQHLVQQPVNPSLGQFVGVHQAPVPATARLNTSAPQVAQQVPFRPAAAQVSQPSIPYPLTSMVQTAQTHARPAETTAGGQLPPQPGRRPRDDDLAHCGPFRCGYREGNGGASSVPGAAAAAELPGAARDGLDWAALKDDGNTIGTCSAVCGTIEELEQHRFRAHGLAPPKNKDPCCRLCLRVVSCRSHLNRHVRNCHTLEFRFSCDMCGKTFSSLSNRDAHIRSVHQKLRPHVCPVCGRGFSRRTHLRVHCGKVHQASLEELERRRLRRQQHRSHSAAAPAPSSSLSSHHAGQEEQQEDGYMGHSGPAEAAGRRRTTREQSVHQHQQQQQLELEMQGSEFGVHAPPGPTPTAAVAAAGVAGLRHDALAPSVVAGVGQHGSGQLPGSVPALVCPPPPPPHVPVSYSTDPHGKPGLRMGSEGPLDEDARSVGLHTATAPTTALPSASVSPAASPVRVPAGLVVPIVQPPLLGLKPTLSPSALAPAPTSRPLTTPTAPASALLHLAQSCAKESLETPPAAATQASVAPSAKAAASDD